MHFGKDKAESFPLDENVFMTGKSSIEVEAKIFDVFGLGKLNIIGMNWWAGRTPRSEGDVGRLGFIDFHPPCFKPALNC
jgi:hypothetical protein